MNANHKLVIGVLAGAALGAAAMQALHAQGKPIAYIVTETEVIDAAALNTFVPAAQAALKQAGGKSMVPGSAKIVAFEGQPPKRMVISVWDSLEKAEAWRKSAAWKGALAAAARTVSIMRQMDTTILPTR